MARLILIPTPIGNLEDITLRALETLKSIDLLFAEDTRHTARLLAHFDIQVPLKSFHQHNEHNKLEEYLEIIESNQASGLVSDAGMPGISDPGFLLVRAAIERGIEIEVLPGPSAVLPALVLSGFPSDRFVFEGFLPHKKGRLKRLQELSEETRTMVFYESPYRIEKAINQMIEIFGPERKASVVREISKLHEEVLRGSLEELLTTESVKNPRGEYVIVLSGAL
ncbi:MAG TPA: 16S rRNA (cytidine(1402)-2'-O)-methyltransferase [Flavobacteriales bacterium]|nr:16S rRNA (cytidine(1402)-2'-O)-methyltransferase [Flavobacteriales bacterium]